MLPMINTAALESLRAFANNLLLNPTPNNGRASPNVRTKLAAFERMCCAATAGEEWAIKQLVMSPAYAAQIEVDSYPPGLGPGGFHVEIMLEHIHNTDCTCPTAITHTPGSGMMFSDAATHTAGDAQNAPDDHETAAGTKCQEGPDGCCMSCGVEMSTCATCCGVGYHSDSCEADV